MALRCENGIGILRFAARAVVAAQGHVGVAAFAVEVVAQDDAAIVLFSLRGLCSRGGRKHF